jgi:hypothetical protein
MNLLNINYLKYSGGFSSIIGKWLYYYFRNKTYSEHKFAYLPTNTISGWVWFKSYYQWYFVISSHKHIDVYSSIRTLKDIERIDTNIYLNVGFGSLHQAIIKTQ